VTVAVCGEESGVPLRGIISASILLSGLLLTFTAQSAVADGDFSQSSASESESSGVPCALASPDGLTAQLICANKAEAAKRLYELDCLTNTPALMEIDRVWISRESLPADAPARDPLLQTLMAKCLVEASQNPNAELPGASTAIEYLRKAVTDSDAGTAGIAVLSLAPVLTKSDIQTVVGVASTRADLAFPAVMALSMSCLVAAQAGIVFIRAASTGRLRTDIDAYMAQPGVQDQAEVCAGKKRRVPQSIVAKAMNVPPATQPIDRSPDATQVMAALNSRNGKGVLQVLLDVQCTPENADAVGEMRPAWHDRESANAGTIRDPSAQAIVARCLIEADHATGSVAELVEAANLLRSAIGGADAMAVLAAVQGLAIIDADQDIRRIAGVPKRNPWLLNSVVRIVGFRCGANNLNTLALIRKEAATQQVRDQIDAVYKHVEPVREGQCGKGK
jgi:hypothetical protein